MKIDRETAEKEFQRFINDMGIDDTNLDEEDQKSFEKQRNLLVDAICSGSLVINDSSEPVYTPMRSEQQDPITFHEPTGATLAEMDKRKANESVARLHATMAAMTKQPAARFANMKIADWKVCTAIVTLFLG